MSKKSGVPLLEVIVMVAVFVGLLIFAGHQYEIARFKAEALTLGKLGIRCTTHGTRFVHVYVDYTDFCDDDFDLLEPVGPFEDFNAAFSNLTPDGLRKLPYPDDITALNLTAMVLDDADLDVLARFPNLQQLDLTATRLTDKGLAKLAEHHGLTNLSLQQCRITDSGLLQLKDLPQLQMLNVAFTDVTADGFEAAGGFDSLTKVVMWPRPKESALQRSFEVEVTRQLAANRGPRRLKRPEGRRTQRLTVKLPEKLKMRFPGYAESWPRRPVLHLSGSEFDDADVELLEHFPFVHNVYLDHTQVSDEGLKKLTRQIYMYNLSLASTKVTDSGMDLLRRFPLLSHVSLKNTAVTDVGLWKLRHVKTLESLDLAGSRVTADGVARLKKERPNLRVKLGP